VGPRDRADRLKRRAVESPAPRLAGRDEATEEDPGSIPIVITESALATEGES
jgi:hypothetical protein